MFITRAGTCLKLVQGCLVLCFIEIVVSANQLFATLQRLASADKKLIDIITWKTY